MFYRDVYHQTSASQAYLQNSTSSANNWVTGVSSDFRNYNPSNSKYSAVATTRAGSVAPQRSFANLYSSGRYSSYYHAFANSAQTASNSANRISYLAPSASRPNNYFWGQRWEYSEPTKAVFNNQFTDGLSINRFSDGNKIVLDNLTIDSRHWVYYNHINLDNNLLTLSNTGVISKVELTTSYQDNTTTPLSPFLFQTHGGIGANAGGAMVTDYVRDSYWQIDDRDTYIIYRPNFGSNKQLPTDVELMGEWESNSTGGRSGS